MHLPQLILEQDIHPVQQDFAGTQVPMLGIRVVVGLEGHNPETLADLAADVEVVKPHNEVALAEVVSSSVADKSVAHRWDYLEALAFQVVERVE